jgi:hypothetical protein
LDEETLQNIESKIVLNQDFERLSIVQLLGVRLDCFLVLQVNDLFDDVATEFLHGQFLEFWFQIGENFSALIDGPILQTID